MILISMGIHHTARKMSFLKAAVSNACSHHGERERLFPPLLCAVLVPEHV